MTCSLCCYLLGLSLFFLFRSQCLLIFTVPLISVALERFNQLLEAFDYGAPPHGGIAPGIDRFIALLSRNATSIRDVIALPKTQAATDPLFGSPDEVSTEQLRDLGLRIVPE